MMRYYEISRLDLSCFFSRDAILGGDLPISRNNSEKKHAAVYITSWLLKIVSPAPRKWLRVEIRRSLRKAGKLAL